MKKDTSTKVFVGFSLDQAIPYAVKEHAGLILRIFFTVSLVFTFFYILNRRLSYNDELPLVNRYFALEPRVFARWRWAFRSDKILDEAYEKVRRDSSHTNASC